MTKRKSATRKTITKATASKTSPTKASPRSTAPGRHNGAHLIVLGFDEQQKPRGARFEDANIELVTKAADAMGFKVYRATTADVADAAKKLPIGRLYATGRGFVPNIRQNSHRSRSYGAERHRIVPLYTITPVIQEELRP